MIQNQMRDVGEVKASDVPPIMEGTDRLVKAIADLDDELSLLIDKIRPVTGPDMNDTAEPGLSLERRSCSDLANVFNHQADRLESIITTVRNVRYRVEL